MILVALIVVVLWIALLTLVVGAMHVATSSPTPQVPARPSLVPRSDTLPDVEFANQAA